MARVLSALVLIPLVLAALWLAPHWWFVALLGAVLVLGFIEYARLSAASGLDIPVVLSCTAALATCVAFASPEALIGVALMAAFVAVGIVAVGRSQPGPQVLGSVAAALFPSLYLGLPLGTMAAIRADYGREGLLLMLVVVWVCDTAQYYAGRMFGRRLLSPTISPKKTVEGAVGGLVFGTAAVAILGHWWLPAVSTPWRVGRRSGAGRPGHRRRPVRVAAEAQRGREGQLDAHPGPRRRARPHRRAAVRLARVLPHPSAHRVTSTESGI